MTNYFDETKSVIHVQRQLISERYESLIEQMRDKHIYRNIVVPNFIFLKEEFYDLYIDYPSWDEEQTTCLFLEATNSKKGLYFIRDTEDDQFIKIVNALDNLIDNDFEDILDELYGEVDDQKRIERLLNALE